jgi:magnesium chelatase subunit H
LYEQLLEIEQRLIPTGLHIFGQAPSSHDIVDLLRMVVSFDRPDVGTRSLPGLIARGLGLPEYQTLLAEGKSSQERLAQRERVEAVAREFIARFLAGEEAAGYLERVAAVPPSESLRILDLLRRICRQLAVNHELESLIRALRGEYLEPGPGADIVQNPGVLPTGRNIHAVNPYAIPSLIAFQKSEATVAALLRRYQGERGCYPEAVGLVLWGMDNIKSQGEGVAQALWLLGVAPRRDGMNRVADVEVIALDRLGRPRIDVVMTVSGIFRDLFGATMNLLDKAARKVALLDEPPEMNFPRKHLLESVSGGAALEDAAIRVFSNAPGSYGTNVNSLVMEGHWERPDEIGDLFVKRKCFAYGRGLEGQPARELMEKALSRVELTHQNIDSFEVGITDVDHYFEYLGGLTQAVQARAGRRPAVYLSDGLAPLPQVRSLDEVVRLETRTKTLNPKWYEGMLKHGYSGVAEIEHHVTNTFGWSATADAVDDWIYQEIAETYILDESMLQRLRELNPYAARALAGRLLEAHSRGFWPAGEDVFNRIRDAFAGLDDEIEGVGTAAKR